MNIRIKLIHLLGGFTQEDIESQINSIQKKANNRIQDILDVTEQRINTISEHAIKQIKEAEDNGSQLYYRGKQLGQYRAAAYFISYAKSLYGRKDWSAKMFDKLTKFLDDIEESNHLNSNKNDLYK